jgi:hypothetical protein
MTSPPDKTIRGVRDTIPPGYVIGRLGLSAGPARLISLKELAAALVQTGIVGPGPGPVPTGDGIWFDGNGVPNDVLGTDGNYFLDITDGVIYQRQYGQWGRPGSIGVGGPSGPTALTGPVTWFSGNGLPSDLVGNNNDLYLDLTTSIAYEKLAGTWS